MRAAGESFSEEIFGHRDIVFIIVLDGCDVFFSSLRLCRLLVVVLLRCEGGCDGKGRRVAQSPEVYVRI